MAPKIFISYRREDTKWVATTLRDALRKRFGSDSVFLDIDNIPVGVDFRVHIQNAIGRCDIVLVIIGTRWAAPIPNSSHRRIDEPDDYLRLEIEAALNRNIPVVPVLIDDTPMPAEFELPASLKELRYRQATRLRWGNDLNRDKELVLIQVSEALGIHQSSCGPALEASPPLPVDEAAEEKTKVGPPPHDGAPRGSQAFVAESPEANVDPSQTSATTPLPDSRKRAPSDVSSPPLEATAASNPATSAPPIASSSLDVFISARSSDSAAAVKVYEFLESLGLRVFYSEISLPRMAKSNFREQIDAAVDGATHFVLVASSVENVESDWVKAEWGMFISEKRAGRKAGNIVTVRLDDLTIAQLPIALRNHMTLTLDDDSLKQLGDFLQLVPATPDPPSALDARFLHSASKPDTPLPGPTIKPKVGAIPKPRAKRASRRRASKYDPQQVLYCLTELSLLISESSDFQVDEKPQKQLEDFGVFVFHVRQQLNARSNRFGTLTQTEEAAIESVVQRLQRLAKWWHQTPQAENQSLWRPDSLSRWRIRTDSQCRFRRSVESLIHEPGRE